MSLISIRDIPHLDPAFPVASFRVHHASSLFNSTVSFARKKSRLAPGHRGKPFVRMGTNSHQEHIKRYSETGWFVFDCYKLSSQEGERTSE